MTARERPVPIAARRRTLPTRALRLSATRAARCARSGHPITHAFHNPLSRTLSPTAGEVAGGVWSRRSGKPSFGHRLIARVPRRASTPVRGGLLRTVVEPVEPVPRVEMGQPVIGALLAVRRLGTVE